MKNISEEIIEIGGKEYTLFLNRKGITNWEKMTKFKEKSKEIQNSLVETEEKDVEISDDTNPFEMYGEEDNFDSALQEAKDMIVKFYWVALYTHHKLSLNEVKSLFEIAVEEYGLEQLTQLMNQMITNANTDILAKNRKNLTALKPTKQN